MKFTFGIITSGGAETNIREITHSIDEEFCGEMNNYEIVIIGGVKEYHEYTNVLRVPFDESVNPGWITKKKNMITELARFDNVVYMHDYVKLMPGWLDGFESFGDDWDICMNKIVDINGNRFRDWLWWDKPGVGEPWTCHEKWCPPQGLRFEGKASLAPYEDADTRYHYVSGTYWVAKRQFMKRYRLNEKIMHCGGEDVEYSLRARSTWKYRMNANSSVQLMKSKELGIMK